MNPRLLHQSPTPLLLLCIVYLTLCAEVMGTYVQYHALLVMHSTQKQACTSTYTCTVIASVESLVINIHIFFDVMHSWMSEILTLLLLFFSFFKKFAHIHVFIHSHVHAFFPPYHSD